MRYHVIVPSREGRILRDHPLRWEPRILWVTATVEDDAEAAAARAAGLAGARVVREDRSREDAYGDLIPSPSNCRSCEHDA
jgi:hypothetical protein